MSKLFSGHAHIVPILERGRPALGSKRVEEDAEFGKRLKALRKRRDLTQKQLAEQLDVHPSLIAQYEGGYIRLHADLIARLAQLLQFSPNELLGTGDIKTTPVTRNRRLLHRLHRLDELPAADQRALVRFLDAMLQRQGTAPAAAAATATAHAARRQRRRGVAAKRRVAGR